MNYRTEREEKQKLRLHLKNCPNPPKAAYHSKRESMRKKSGEIYNFKWEEPDPIRVKYQRTPSKNCVKCSKNLTPEDRSSFLIMDQGNNDESLQFVPICFQSKVTGISICVLKMAAKRRI